MKFNLSNCDAETNADRGLKVYADINSDGIFSVTENIYTSALLDNKDSVLEANISFDRVPTPSYNLAVRVVCIESSDLDDILPCGNYDKGMTVDFEVSILSGIKKPELVLVSRFSNKSVILQWDDLSRSPNDSFNILKSVNNASFSLISVIKGRNNANLEYPDGRNMTFIDDNVTTNTEYKYLIQSFNDTETSNYSDTTSIIFDDNDTYFTIETDNQILEKDSGEIYYSAFVDLDNDGDLDFYKTRWLYSYIYNLLSPIISPLYFINNGNGEFEKTFPEKPDGSIISEIGIAWGDINNDFYPEQSLVSQIAGSNAILKNNRDLTFSVETPWAEDNSMLHERSSWIDYDNDGYLDLFYSSTGNG